MSAHRLPLLLGLTAAALAGRLAYWRTTTRAVLYDFSYIFNNAYRIAHGDVPYRDFPLPHPPGTFLIQAALIKAFGPDYRVVIAYVVVTSAAAIALTYVIAGMVLADWPRRWLAAFALVVPIAILGPYMLYPHPFYDPDTTLFMLAGIAGILLVRRAPPHPWLGVPVGVLLVVPVFIKQNVGLAFFALIHLALLTLFAERSRMMRRRWAFIVLGSVAGLVGFAGLIALTAGLGNYVHWTVSYAASRRGGFTYVDVDMYGAARVWCSIAAFGAGLLVARRWPTRAGQAAAAALLAVGPVWMAWEGMVFADQAIVKAAWSFTLALGCLVALPALVSRRPRVEDALPFVILGVAHASFLSQGADGSTYGMWALVAVSLACTARHIPRLAPGAMPAALAFVAVFAVGLALPGARYMASQQRLNYAPVRRGPMTESRTKALRGMRDRGSLLPELDSLVRYVRATIPADDAIVEFHGGDPLFYAADRKPRYPVVLFDPTVNPYNVDQTLANFRRYDVKWVIFKGPMKKLSSDGFYVALHDRMQADYRLRAQFGPYWVWARADVP